MITALIIDDEAHNRNVLKTLLHKYCSQIEVLAESDSAEDGYKKILQHEPQLVFLDIKMPGRSGFDLLKMFTEINFEVIFVSAYNEYAIDAFEFNALDYIVKPIDYAKLIKAVAKATAKIEADGNGNSILHFIKTLDEKNDLINKLSFHHNGKVAFANVSEVAFIEAKVDLCEINFVDKSKFTSCKSLKLYENLLKPVGHFMRINKSVLINADHIKGYTKGEPCIVELGNGNSFEVSRRKKAEILSKLRQLIG
jgi:two-component system LytT family response regulator